MNVFFRHCITGTATPAAAAAPSPTSLQPLASRSNAAATSAAAASSRHAQSQRSPRELDTQAATGASHQQHELCQSQRKVIC